MLKFLDHGHRNFLKYRPVVGDNRRIGIFFLHLFLWFVFNVNDIIPSAKNSWKYKNEGWTIIRRFFPDFPENKPNHYREDSKQWKFQPSTLCVSCMFSGIVFSLYSSYSFSHLDCIAFVCVWLAGKGNYNENAK